MRMSSVTRRGVRAWLLGVSIVAVAASSVAHAQQPAPGEDQARMHFRLGRAYYDSGEFDRAATEFDEAYRLSQRPQLLYNIYVSRRDAGQTRQAVDALRRYLELVPDAQDREQLSQRLRAMERTLASTPEPIPTAPTTPSTTPPTNPESTPATTPLSTQAEPAQQPVEPTMSPPSGDSEPEVASSGSSIVPYVLMGGGGALVIGGVITGLMASSQESEIADMCPGDVCPSDYDLEGERSSGKTLALLTDVLIGAGVATAAVGIVLMLGSGGESSDDATTATATCGASGCFGLVRGSF